MLQRYKSYRGKRPPNDPLPKGTRQDTRKHTRHCLRPTKEMVEKYLGDTTAKAWAEFEREYLGVLKQRFAEDRMPFDQLAESARELDIHLGCNCPTNANPDVNQCHTVLALRFMKEKYPKLVVRFPD